MIHVVTGPTLRFAPAHARRMGDLLPTFVVVFAVGLGAVAVIVALGPAVEQTVTDE
jgi:hypothetical protein